ncbi:MAG: glycine cleavage system aminomethyltransferase GcvT [Chloroflexi bacterium]|nr:glycine cleavage system aminomethyltransferase GcvT [Chloroflexota bacterium]
MSNELKKTVLYSVHRQLGATMVPFSGWEMPVRYSGDIAEHKAVRERAGIFDVSHMGRYEVRGPAAVAFLQRVHSNDASALKIGQAHYGLLCNERGGVVDDVIVYRRGEEFFWIVVNAGNRQKDWDWLMTHKLVGATLTDESDAWALIALQGPQAMDILRRFTDLDFARIPYYHAADATVAGYRALVARTGYTGEDGVEIAVASNGAADLWAKLMEAGATPCGLGARDTLRLEAGMPLYGHELTDDTNPLEANLKRFIKMDKPFIGQPVLAQSLVDGLKRKLVGVALVDRGIARAECAVRAGGQAVGVLTSGGPSITTGQNIGMCYLPVALAKPDTEVEVVVREKPLKAKVVKTPFYSRKKS